jgi:hypothetical protein
MITKYIKIYLLISKQVILMPKKNIFVRGIDEDVFLKFKSKSVVKKKTLGEAFNDAMVLWLKTNSK